MLMVNQDMGDKTIYSLLDKNRGWIGTEREPGMVLNRFVERFWLSSRHLQEKGEYQVLPDCNFDLILKLKDSTCTILLAGPFTHLNINQINAGDISLYFSCRFYLKIPGCVVAGLETDSPVWSICR